MPFVTRQDSNLLVFSSQNQFVMNLILWAVTEILTAKKKIRQIVMICLCVTPPIQFSDKFLGDLKRLAKLAV